MEHWPGLRLPQCGKIVGAFGALFSSSKYILQHQVINVLGYIDQLIGSRSGGNVFVVATLPYGMVKAVADVDGQNKRDSSTMAAMSRASLTCTIQALVAIPP
ncbi:hypothetical protein PAAG_04552 [Paracoccidioides lutzii Pb01]|uniref:Glycosyl hydrolase family 92 N-terminal domain-containing protein n=1 Tax=Paracoccidioides lutzii (strain ATCC MYA-826 / Pb01) TaxID=502779 RepID=C1H1A8_PARBA|nr:hypothetical protein PAAG_04552 [Paracoccidioides lutzii Pb01]EEH33502.2 hypothetical protein PAAG_04552 [Paracoccidioides lutzii Pb01]